MLESESLIRVVCNEMCERHGFLSSQCDVLPYLHKCPWAALKLAANKWYSWCPICSETFYGFFYWKVIFSCVVGMFRAFNVFMDMNEMSDSCITTWRDRKYFVLSAQAIKRGRLFGSSLTFVNWLFLMLAIIFLKPILMLPWIFMNTMISSIEALLYVYDLLVGNVALEFRTVISFLLLYSSLANVICLYSLIAESKRSAQELRLWQCLISQLFRC